MKAQIQSAYSMLKRRNKSKFTPRHTVVKLQHAGVGAGGGGQLLQRHPGLLGPHPEPGFMLMTQGSHPVMLVGVSHSVTEPT